VPILELGRERSPAELSPIAPSVIAGGVVAHNDEGGIERSVRSLLAQELPLGARWGRIWIVASGCTDRTVEIARTLAAEDPRLGLLIEPERRGKAAALREVLRRADGEALVLLNSDAVAAPGSVAALLSKSKGKRRPFAVMARPVVPSPVDSGWNGTVRWMWQLHHELHREMLEDGRGAHLSDELLLVSLPAFPWVEDGIINDGSYCAVWLQTHEGGCWYAPDARVWIDVPSSPSEHLRQRRRIHVGNAQVNARLGRFPTTALRYLFGHPSRAIAALRRAGSEAGSLRHFARVALWELASHALGVWDRLPPRADHVRWSRIGPNNPAAPPSTTPPPSPTITEGVLDQRVRVLLSVAGQFGTGVSLSTLSSLLPEGAAGPPESLGEFLARRPDLARVARGIAYPPGLSPTEDRTRATRGTQYRKSAEGLIHGPIAWLLPYIRCIGVTGSAAYGEPDEGDDLDFFVVARAGALAWVLASTYASLRLHALRQGRSVWPPPCFNYVIDERRVHSEFDRGRGLLFAREALTAQMIEGDPYYRGLLQKASWMGAELPTLYAARTVDAGNTRLRPVPIGIRFLSALAFLPLAAYLQLAGMRRNHESRRAGHPSAQFRTATESSRIAFLSRRFEELRDRYQAPPEPSRTLYPGTTAPSRIPSSR